MAPGPVPVKKKKKWATVDTHTQRDYNIDLSLSHPGDIYQKNWSQASGFRRSLDGSAGVFFVQVPSGIVVIKGSSTPGQERFAAVLAERIGVTVPKVRVLEYSKPEWLGLKTSLFKLTEAIGGLTDREKVKKELDRPNLLGM